MVLSEYGGYNYLEKSHSFGENFGYRRLGASQALLMTDEILQTKGSSTAVDTQFSDVEDEVKGLLTYDRKVIKLPVQAVREINRRLV